MVKTVKIYGPPLHKGGFAPTCYKCKKSCGMYVSILTDKVEVWCHGERQVERVDSAPAFDTFRKTWYTSSDLWAFRPGTSFIRKI